MRIERGPSKRDVECRLCHETIPAATVKVKLLPVEGDDRWYYYYHPNCFAEGLGGLVESSIRLLR